MSSIQSYIGSAYGSYPIRWIETPESARSLSAQEIAEKSIEKVRDPDAGKPKNDYGDVLDVSPETKRVLESAKTDSKIEVESADRKQQADKAEQSEESPQSESSLKSPSGKALTPEEQQQIEALKARDQEVRIHEHAHAAAGGQFVTSGPSYTYQTGPDGKKYAVGGEVGIDTAPVSGDPQATIQKMQMVASAALAPAEPSGQDMKVAAAARQTQAKAQAELAQQKAAEMSGTSESPEGDAAETPQTITSEQTAESKPAELKPSGAKAEETDAASMHSASENARIDKKAAAKAAEIQSAAKSFAAGALSAASAAAYQSQSAMSLSSAARFTAFA